MNPLPSWHHGFFKSRIAFGQRRRQGNHVLHVHALSGKQHDFMAQACGFEAVVRYQHTRHALPLDFSTSMATKISRKSRSKPTNGFVQQGKVAAAQLQAQKCYPFSPCRRTIQSDICSNRPQSARTFAASAMISPFIGFIHKNSDILHRGQVSGRRFPETENPFCGKYCVSCPISAFPSPQSNAKPSSCHSRSARMLIIKSVALFA